MRQLSRGRGASDGHGGLSRRGSSSPSPLHASSVALPSWDAREGLLRVTRLAVDASTTAQHAHAARVAPAKAPGRGEGGRGGQPWLNAETKLSRGKRIESARELRAARDAGRDTARLNRDYQRALRDVKASARRAKAAWSDENNAKLRDSVGADTEEGALGRCRERPLKPAWRLEGV